MSRQDRVEQQLRAVLAKYQVMWLTPEIKAEIHLKVFEIIGRIFEYELDFENNNITLNITGEIKHGKDKN